ncbi:hypothetical protein P43SY_011555 [Pythium insidiosum]|uniref:Uncharacterized protein n=1 Tax=Pythium insidiosum TaxID=114742 RepID=A0AAD5LQP6_PYTIN|nr:hypothetical protein P43SY_011555 [Pythium insidiosum]
MSPSNPITIAQACHHHDAHTHAHTHAHTQAPTQVHAYTDTDAVRLVDAARQESVAAFDDYRRSATTPSLLEIEQEALKLEARIDAILQRLGDALVGVAAAKAILEKRDFERRCLQQQAEAASLLQSTTPATAHADDIAGADADDGGVRAVVAVASAKPMASPTTARRAQEPIERLATGLGNVRLRRERASDSFVCECRGKTYKYEPQSHLQFQLQSQ